jgi:hypothetical protein
LLLLLLFFWYENNGITDLRKFYYPGALVHFENEFSCIKFTSILTKTRIKDGGVEEIKKCGRK